MVLLGLFYQTLNSIYLPRKKKKYEIKITSDRNKTSCASENKKFFKNMENDYSIFVNEIIHKWQNLMKKMLKKIQA